MRRILLMLVMVLVCMTVCAQELKIKSFERSSMDLIASTSPRKDANDKFCGVVRVLLPYKGVTFLGNVVGDVSFDGSEYIVYLSPMTRFLKINSPGYKPLMVQFAEYDIAGVECKATYVMDIDVPQANDRHRASGQENRTVRVNGASEGTAAVSRGNMINGHEYVDLGLPSGLLWATCNVGANKPEEYGNYYAWGETKTKPSYSETNCITEHKHIGNYSGNPKYDVATADWGFGWRTPTQDEFEELEKNCTFSRQKSDGVYGYKVISRINGNSIFIPAAGEYDRDDLDYEEENAELVCSSMYNENNRDSYYLSPTKHNGACGVGYYGQSVRPVYDRNEEKNTIDVDLNTSGYMAGHAYVDLGLPSGTKWATCNVGADKAEDFGDYYAWGELKPKSNYTEENSVTENRRINEYSGNPQYDVATVKWGWSWKTPTKEDFHELKENCTFQYVKYKFVKGFLVTSKINGKQIFFPAAGYRSGTSYGQLGKTASLQCSSTLYADNNRNGFHISPSYIGLTNGVGYTGDNVRPVTR